MPDNLHEIAERLQALKRQDVVKSVEISRTTGISAENISRYLNAKRLPKGNNLILLAGFFGVDPGWIITGQPQESGDKSSIPGYNSAFQNLNERESGEEPMSASQKDQLIDFLNEKNRQLEAKNAELEALLAGKPQSQGRRKKAN